MNGSCRKKYPVPALSILLQPGSMPCEKIVLMFSIFADNRFKVFNIFTAQMILVHA